MQSEDSINKYRFPKTLSEQRRFLGLPYDEAIPTFIPLAWGLYAGSQMLGICAAALIWFAINTAKKGEGQCGSTTCSIGISRPPFFAWYSKPSLTPVFGNGLDNNGIISS